MRNFLIEQFFDKGYIGTLLSSFTGSIRGILLTRKTGSTVVCNWSKVLGKVRDDMISLFMFRWFKCQILIIIYTDVISKLNGKMFDFICGYRLTENIILYTDYELYASSVR